MKMFRAQIKALFTLYDDPDYTNLFMSFGQDMVWIAYMQDQWQREWGGEYQEFANSLFFDWKTKQQRNGKVVFWIQDHFGEIYGLAIDEKHAELIYGLKHFRRSDNLKSSWDNE